MKEQHEQTIIYITTNTFDALRVNGCECGCACDVLDLDLDSIKYANIQIEGFEATQDAIAVFNQGDHSKGIEMMLRAISTYYPESRELWLTVSKMQDTNQNREGAIASAQKMLDLSEQKGSLDQLYADGLQQMSFLHLKTDMVKAVEYYKKWQQYDRYAIKTVENDDGTISHFIPANMVTPELKAAVTEDHIRKNFCDSPEDIIFIGNEMRLKPKWNNKVSKKDVEGCTWGCDCVAATALTLCQSRFKTKQGQITCGLGVATFSTKCRKCCEMGFWNNCVEPYINTLPQGVDWGFKPSRDTWH